MLFLLQDVQAALQRAKEAADAAAAAEAQRYALLQAAKLQESAQLQVQLEQVCISSACRTPAVLHYQDMHQSTQVVDRGMDRLSAQCSICGVTRADQPQGAGSQCFWC
jgi:hypothetical protein